MEWATGKWKVLSRSSDHLSLSLLYFVGFFQSWASESVTSAFPASVPAHRLAGLAPWHCCLPGAWLGLLGLVHCASSPHHTCTRSIERW